MTVVPNSAVFLRKKTISGNDYWYLVENERVDGKVKQRVIKYIGNDEKLERFRKGVAE